MTNPVFIPASVSRLCLTMLILTGAAACTAADLVGVRMASDTILHLEVHDGRVSYHGKGGIWWEGKDNQVMHEPLDLAAAAKPEAYRLEPAVGGAAIVPVRIGRKSKGIYYNAPNAQVPFILGHQLYLQLSAPLTAGTTYTLVTEGLFANSKRTAFTFDPARLRSETVRVNQVGFAPQAVKFAYLSHWLGDMGSLDLDACTGKPFHIVDHGTGKSAFSGTIAMRLQHNQQLKEAHNPTMIPNRTFADIAECDFSDLATPGIYRVVVPGIGCSYPFEVGTQPIQRSFYTSMKGLYFQRSGIVKELPDGRLYPRAHHPDDNRFHYLKGKRVLHQNNLPKSDAAIATNPPVTGIWGWYNDASDWDSYPQTHYRIPMQLMLLYQMSPEGYADGEIANRYKLSEASPWIEEGGNGLPDLLDEAAWMVRFGQRARAALQQQGLGAGGVPGYVGRDAMGGASYKGVNPSWDDRRPLAVSAEDPLATMAYAASAAWYAHCLELCAATPAGHVAKKKELFSAEEIASWWREADEAYRWATANGYEEPINDKPSDKGFRTIAAILLWQHSGNRAYAELVGRALGVDDQSNYHIESDLVPTHFLAANLASITPGLAAAAGPEGAANIAKRIAALDRVSQQGRDRTDREDMRYGGWDFLSFGLGVFSTPKVLLQAAMHARTGDKAWLDCVQHSVSFVLGGNQLNQCRITMLGENPLNAGVHHIDSWVLNETKHPVYSWEPLPGYVTYFGDTRNWVQGIGDHRWTSSTAYPAHEKSPRSEMNFPNRESINGSEYTIHQNILSSAFAAGYLRAKYVSGKSTWRPDPARPSVRLDVRPNAGNPNAITLSVSGRNLERVAYYYDWHYIGTASGPPFELTWDAANTTLVPRTKVRITAVGYDLEGTPSRPQTEGEREITIGSP